MNKKAVIAMSGGVDSSVAAFLLKDAGFECIGVTMKLFANAGATQSTSCCSLADVKDARQVAYGLDMPHYVFNFSDDFKNLVIRNFIETYRQGATPNPCIDCNRYIKFERLLLRTKQIGFEYIATGHYARIEQVGERFFLKKARDPKKDQSYVLYTMTQEQLACTLFPLGDMTKGEVREIALAQGFVNAKKQDSQDICFVSNHDYARFIEQYTGKSAEPGPIIDMSGRILGTHRGLIRYTIGQRRGLGLSFPEPRYVSGKSIVDNTLILGREETLYAKALIADNIIACPELGRPIRVKVKTRYLQTEQGAVAEQVGADRIRIDFDEPQRAITAGQAAVIYDGDLVIGGGTIVGEDVRLQLWKAGH